MHTDIDENDKTIQKAVGETDWKLMPVTAKAMLDAAKLDTSELLAIEDVELVKKKKIEMTATLSTVKTLRGAISAFSRELDRALTKWQEGEGEREAKRTAAEGRKLLAVAKEKSRKIANVAKRDAPTRVVILFEFAWPELVSAGLAREVTMVAEQAVQTSSGGESPMLFQTEVHAWVKAQELASGYLSRFVAGAPRQAGTSKHGRSLGPVKTTLPFAKELMAKLRGTIPCSANIAPLEARIAASVSAYWNTPTLAITYMERSMLGAIRLQMSGDSELILIPLADIMKLKEVSMKEIDKLAGLTEDQLKKMSLESKAVTRLSLSLGSLAVLPAGVVVFERGMNGAPSYGFKMPFMHCSHKCSFEVAYKLCVESFAEHPHMPQMTEAARCYTAL